MDNIIYRTYEDQRPDRSSVCRSSTTSSTLENISTISRASIPEIRLSHSNENGEVNPSNGDIYFKQASGHLDINSSYNLELTATGDDVSNCTRRKKGSRASSVTFAEPGGEPYEQLQSQDDEKSSTLSKISALSFIGRKETMARDRALSVISAIASAGKKSSKAGHDDTAGLGRRLGQQSLSEEEKRFLLSVDRGDIPRVREILANADKHKTGLNINCMDMLGRTALQIAIENENELLVDLLLDQPTVQIGDNLLHAINADNILAVHRIISHHSHTGNKKNLSGVFGTVPSNSFTPDITPIILAAHKNNYQILQILLDRGDRINTPHDVRCHCSDCVRNHAQDYLNHSRSRFNAYRALTSPCYIALTSHDPILTAFELSWELKRLSRIENEFTLDYETLSVQCQDFAVSLLDETRGSQELKTVLNYDPRLIRANPLTEGISWGEEVGSEGEGEWERMGLARFKLAIKYKQKKFVAHASCQQLMTSLWYQGIPADKRHNYMFQALLFGSISLLFPFLAIFYIFAPRTRIGRYMKKPIVKFFSKLASYAVFLLLLILASLHIEAINTVPKSMHIQTDNSTNPSKRSREVRGTLPTKIEWVIIIYVVSLVWDNIKQLWREGGREYVRDMWNLVDTAINAMYITTFTLKFVAYYVVQREIREGKIDIAYAPRPKWDAFDPDLLAEAIFAWANIFSTLKLIQYFTMNPHLGPMQLSLGRMIGDVVKFFALAFLVVFAYSCGVNQLYNYYAGANLLALCKDDCKDNPTSDTCTSSACSHTFANLFEVVQTMYFAIYGVINVDQFELLEPHVFTVFMGKLMFGTYCAVMIVVLINMLIAMLSNSFLEISNAADVEWKFARSKLWMGYFEEGATVPPPFNIIPTPKSAWHFIQWIGRKCYFCSEKAKENKWMSIRKHVRKVSERDAQYQRVMKDLVRRYIVKCQRSKLSREVTEDDINELKHDISAFRYELLETLRQNGLNVNERSDNIREGHTGRSRARHYLSSFDIGYHNPHLSARDLEDSSSMSHYDHLTVDQNGVTLLNNQTIRLTSKHLTTDMGGETDYDTTNVHESLQRLVFSVHSASLDIPIGQPNAEDNQDETEFNPLESENITNRNIHDDNDTSNVSYTNSNFFDNNSPKVVDSCDIKFSTNSISKRITDNGPHIRNSSHHTDDGIIHFRNPEPHYPGYRHIDSSDKVLGTTVDDSLMTHSNGDLTSESHHKVTGNGNLKYKFPELEIITGITNPVLDDTVEKFL